MCIYRLAQIVDMYNYDSAHSMNITSIIEITMTISIKSCDIFQALNYCKSLRDRGKTLFVINNQSYIYLRFSKLDQLFTQ